MQVETVFPGFDGKPLPAILTTPDGVDGPLPALLMIYEIYGMTDEMREVARDLATEGYAVLIPDLFARGRVKPLCVAATMRTMTRGQGPALDDLESARRFLAERPEVDAERIGVIGFCMGGGFAILLAGTGRYRVSAPFYGPGDGNLTRSCPMVASYGGNDASTRGVPAQLEASLERLDVPHDVKVYPEAGHSFYNPASGLLPKVAARLPMHAAYDPAAAADSRRRIVAFFREHLAG